MKLKNIVTSLETSKKLEEKEFAVDTCFNWYLFNPHITYNSDGEQIMDNDEAPEWSLYSTIQLLSLQQIPAYDVGTLGVVLVPILKKHFWKLPKPFEDRWRFAGTNSSYAYYDTEVEARAEQLIWLIDNNFYKKIT